MSNVSNIDIPEEIQIEILSRLPPKSLSRFKCVSKHWNTTLTTQAFLVSHSRSYDKHPKHAYVAISSELNSILSIELNDDNTPKATTVTITTPPSTSLTVGTRKFTTTGVKGSTEAIIRAQYVHTDFLSKYSCMSNICNDLVCLFYHCSTKVGLLNRKTRDFINLPQVPTKSTGDIIMFWYTLLGFDPVRKVFKVLSIYSESKRGSPKAVTLTLGSNYWNPIKYDCLSFTTLTKISTCSRITDALCLDGVIYWMYETKTLNAGIVIVIIAFDLNHETLKDYEIIVPPIEVVSTFGYHLTSLKGSPTLFTWQMKSDGNHEIQQSTLFNHKNTNASWTETSFISQSFPTMFYCSKHKMRVSVAGGRILLQYVKFIKGRMKSQERDNTKSSWYLLYDLEKFAVDFAN